VLKRCALGNRYRAPSTDFNCMRTGQSNEKRSKFSPLVDYG